MNSEVWNFIQSNPRLGKNLFAIANIPEDFSLWTNHQFEYIQWLYKSTEQEVSIIGVDGDIVYAINDDGELVEVCKHLQNIPYEFLRRKSFYEGTVQEVFNTEPELIEALSHYEKWCRESGLVLDIDSVYHDKNGKLFDNYFDSTISGQ